MRTAIIPVFFKDPFFYYLSIAISGCLIMSFTKECMFPIQHPLITFNN